MYQIPFEVLQSRFVLFSPLSLSLWNRVKSTLAPRVTAVSYTHLVAGGAQTVEGYLYHTGDKTLTKHTFSLGTLTEDERKIILAGSLTGRAKEEREEAGK